jgi:uncharacterized protein YgbK (DUF1537 family)
MPLITAGSGVAIGLPENFSIKPNHQAAVLPPAAGAKAVLSGSCSRATNGQVAHFIESNGESFCLDPLVLIKGEGAVEGLVREVLSWAHPRLGQCPILIYSTTEPQVLKRVQEQLGGEQAGALVERALARIAQGLVAAGVGQLIVAGGETSGAVVQALGMTQLQIGAQIDPGVPWCASSSAISDRSMHIALKSGNFGGPDFFTRAFERIEST